MKAKSTQGSRTEPKADDLRMRPADFDRMMRGAMQAAPEKPVETVKAPKSDRRPAK